MIVGILGAGGIIAPAIVRDLAESEEASELRLLDIDLPRAQEVARVHGGKKSVVERVDARSDLARHLQGIDVLVNSASYRVNLSAMQACLDVGAHYIDLGGLYHLTGDQLAMNDAFRDAGRLALLGMGSAPGKTNVMAARAVQELGCTPDVIDVLAAGRDLNPPAGPSYPYSPRTLVDELTLAPIAIHDGKPIELEAMQDAGEYYFPPPIGNGRMVYTLHSEVRTFGESFGCRECSFRLSLAPEVLSRLEPLLTASDEQIQRAAHEAVPPSGQAVSAHVILASAGQRTVAVTAVTHGMDVWGLGGGIVSTAAPAAAAVRLLARGSIGAVGALPPERCVEPGDMFPELEKRMCAFNIKETVPA